MPNSQDTPLVHLIVPLEAAKALSRALDVYSRIGMGQVGIVDEMHRMDEVAIGGRPGGPEADRDRMFAVADHLAELSKLLGWCSSSSAGIARAPLAARQAHEVRAVLNQTLAFHRDPNAKYRGVDHDGLVLRYTDDPAPVAWIDAHGYGGQMMAINPGRGEHSNTFSPEPGTCDDGGECGVGGYCGSCPRDGQHDHIRRRVRGDSE